MHKVILCSLCAGLPEVFFIALLVALGLSMVLQNSDRVPRSYMNCI